MKKQSYSEANRNKTGNNCYIPYLLGGRRENY